MSDDRDLESIYRKLSGNPMLYLPANPAAPRSAAPSQPGPKIGVRLAYADVFGGRGDLKDYYQTIRSLPVRGTIAVLAGIGRCSRPRAAVITSDSGALLGKAMLDHFFPAASNRLRVNVKYGGGEADAILDYGPYAVLFEIKSALLAEPAKRGGERDALKADVDKRYDRDENGPRAVVQLARACRAARQGKLGLTNASARLYPIIVTDEVCASAPGFNRYLHGRFREKSPPTATAPLTVMSIVELEELLPYLDTGALAFDAVLNSRFTTSDDVNPVLSVHQAIYQANVGKPGIRNGYLLKHFESLRDDIRSLFGTG